MSYTIAFDVYGTLIDRSGVYNSLKELIGKKAKPFMDMWRDKQLEYSFRRGLMNTYVDFSICTKEALDYSCLRFDIHLTIKQKEDLMNEYNFLPMFSDVDNGLQQLKDKGHNLYAFSNGSQYAVTNLLKNAKIIEYFEGVISVENTKTFKPDPVVYKYFSTQTNSTKEDSWLVSSNPFDVIGAISYGMKSAWIQRKPESIFDPWEIKPTIRSKSISELINKLPIER